MTTTSPVYSLFDPRFYPAYWVHMRPYLLYVSGAAGWAGMAISSATHSTAFYLLFFIPFFMGYGFAQALTDCFQVDTDRLSAPYRPLSKGIVTPRSVGAMSLIGLLGIGIILVYCNLQNLGLAVVSVAGLASYSYVKRHFWFLGPFYNAWIVALLPVMGFLGMDATLGLVDLTSPIFWAVVFLTFFSYTNFVLIGYLKDISADRTTGYRTFPVVFGWNASVWVGDIVLIISAVLCFGLAMGDFWGMLVASLGTAVAVAGQLYAHLTRDKTEANAHFPIAATVRSLILWHGAVVIAYRPEWRWAFLAFYVLFEATLWIRPAKEQI